MPQSPTVEPMWEAILRATGGKPYTFVVMPFGSRFDTFQVVERAVERAVGLSCIRADNIPASGYDLLGKVQMAIGRAEVVIVDISEPNQNVFYELGYAAGIRKPILLIAEKGVAVPTNLKGLQLIEYEPPRDRAKAEAFSNSLQAELQSRVNTQVALLKDMLLGESPLPACIFAHPLYPSSSARIRGQLPDWRTFGDNLGILGLLSAFGAIFGETTNVELVSARYYAPELPERDVNLYLIGSGKANPATPGMLRRLMRDREPKWELAPAPGESAQGDYPVSLYRTERGGTNEVKGKTGTWPSAEGSIVHTEDYGIVMRGPHPDHPNRLVLVMAGAHSIGTGAACLAATKSFLIQRIKQKLPEGVLADKHCTFWALVRGKTNDKDGMLDMEGVKVEEAGVYSGA